LETEGPVNDALAAAFEIQEFLLAEGWPFCFIGGLAVQRWGEPRMTGDADLTLITGFGTEEPFVDKLLAAFASRLPDARQFALLNRVLLLRASNGAPIDVGLGALPFEVASAERATWWQMGDGKRLKTCSAEDLLVHKAFAGRDHDWGDVAGILMRQAKKLNLAQAKADLAPLAELKEEPQILSRLDSLLKKYNLG
jgi:hypothetical protein